MRKLFSTAILALSVLALLSSCVTKKKFTELMSEKDSARKMLAETQTKVNNLEDNVKTLEENVDDLSNKNTQLSSENSSLNSELSNVKGDLSATKTKIAEVEKTAEKTAKENAMLNDGIKGVFNPYTSNGLTLNERGNELLIALSQPIRYGSGSTRLSKESKASLETIAKMLEANPEIKLVVEGHTDKIPLKEDAPWKNNWELSKARANTVVQTLVRLGAKKEQLSSVGRAHNMPVNTGASDAADSSKNRRTELVVIADVTGLYKITTSN